MSKYETCDICQGDIEHHVDEKTGKTYWTHGHNAEPVLNGRCCDTCNEHVFSLRLKQMQMSREHDQVTKFDTRVTIESLAKYIIQDRRNQLQESK